MLKFNRCLSCHAMSCLSVCLSFLLLSGRLIHVYQPIPSLMVQAAHSSPSSIIGKVLS